MDGTLGETMSSEIANRCPFLCKSCKRLLHLLPARVTAGAKRWDIQHSFNSCRFIKKGRVFMHDRVSFSSGHANYSALLECISRRPNKPRASLRVGNGEDDTGTPPWFTWGRGSLWRSVASLTCVPIFLFRWPSLKRSKVSNWCLFLLFKSGLNNAVLMTDATSYLFCVLFKWCL